MDPGSECLSTVISKTIKPAIFVFIRSVSSVEGPSIWVRLSVVPFQFSVPVGEALFLPGVVPVRGFWASSVTVPDPSVDGPSSQSAHGWGAMPTPAHRSLLTRGE